MTDHPTRGLLAELAFGEEAGALAGEPVASVLLGLCSGLRAEVAARVAPDDGRGRHALETALVDELDPVALHLAWALDRLQGTDWAPTPADGFALGRAYAAARLEMAVPALRPVLRGALVRLLDPGIYRTAAPTRLLGAVARLGPEGAADPSTLDPGLARLLAPPQAPPDAWTPPWQRGHPLAAEGKDGA